MNIIVMAALEAANQRTRVGGRKRIIGADARLLGGRVFARP